MSLALAIRNDSAAAPLPDEASSLPVPLDLAYKRRLVRRLDPDRAWAEASPDDREECRQKQRFVAEIDYLRRRGTPRDAACAAAASHPEWYPILLARGLALNLPNYDQWRKRLDAAGNHPKALLRQYKAGAARRQLSVEWYPRFAEMLCGQFFHVNGLDFTASYRNACVLARRTGLDDDGIPSASQAERYLRRVLGERVQIMLRDPQRYRDELSGYLMLRWNCEPGAVWIGDHRVLDIFIRHPVTDDDGNVRDWIALRPWCTAWMDAKSGYIVAMTLYCSTYPNSAKILETLYLAIRANGNIPPMLLITDNGKDYLKKGALRDLTLQTQNEPTRGANGRNTLVEETFADVVACDGQEYRHSVARALGTGHRTTAPYKGRQKPIERVFRNFARAFDKMFYGYCGNKPGRRPEEMDEFRGNVMRLITEAELDTIFRQWIEDGYHRAPTRSRRTGGRTPREVWDSRRPMRTPMDDRELQWAMLLPHANLLQVRSGPGGSNVWYGNWPYEGVSDEDHIAIGDMHGRQLLVKTSWAPSLPDIRYGSRMLPARIWLFHPDGRYLAEAQPAMERDVFGTSEAQRTRISETCRKVAVLRRADREAKEALAGTLRIMAPAHQLGLQNMTGPVRAAELPPDSGPDGTLPAVASAISPGSARGRAGAPPTPADTTPTPPREPAPDAASRFAQFLSRRGAVAQTPDDPPPSGDDAAARMAAYLAQKREEAGA